MALVRCDFFSEVLEVGTSMTVLLPQAGERQVGVEGGRAGRDDGAGGPPVLYLLHGLSDDASAWLRYTSIERYAAPLGLAVVMPQVQRSWYADEVHGSRYWTHLSEELPGIVDSFFRVSRRREDTFVAGLSMGGYGALKWALHQPERFAAAASLSGALDLHDVLGRADGRDVAERVFGGRLRADDDLLELVAQADVQSLPSLYVGCGTEDDLVGGSVRFVDEALLAGVDVHVDFRAGEHEWGLWDAMVRDVLAWLPRPR